MPLILLPLTILCVQTNNFTRGVATTRTKMAATGWQFHILHWFLLFKIRLNLLAEQGAAPAERESPRLLTMAEIDHRVAEQVPSTTVRMLSVNLKLLIWVQERA